MAKVHKARKSSRKYSFQKKKISVKTLLIVLAVVVVAAVGLKLAYDNYRSGTFEVTAPTAEQLNNIAANWEILDSNTDKFLNYYTMMGLSTDGTDGSGNALLIYTGNENLEEVALQLRTADQDPAATEVTTSGSFLRTSLTDFVNGVAPWGQATIQLVASTDNCLISIYDEQADAIDDAVLTQLLSEIETIIAAGPVVTEEVVEATEELPAE